jgi:formiminotetrahydrofolate cyclodeaminase
VPGGGAVAAIVGAMAAALVGMVANLTLGRPRYAAAEVEMGSILAEVERYRTELLRLADADAAAYEAVGQAMRLPRGSDEERQLRSAAIQRALAGAASPPAEVMDVCRAIVPLCLRVAARGNSNVASDAGVAGELAAAGVRSSMFNIRVNLGDLKDAQLVRSYENRIASAEAGLEDDVNRLTAIVRAKIAPKAPG